MRKMISYTFPNFPSIFKENWENVGKIGKSFPENSPWWNFKSSKTNVLPTVFCGHWTVNNFFFWKFDSDEEVFSKGLIKSPEFVTI